VKGLILFAHGARDPNWAKPFELTAQRAAVQRPDWQVRLAFLEFMPPALDACGDELAARGCTEVDVVPLFLGAGGHVRKDVPRLLRELQARHPGIRWTLQPAVGESDILIDAMARIAVETAQPRSTPTP